MNVENHHVRNHPLLRYYLTQLRNRKLPAWRVRHLVKMMGTLLAYELTSELEVIPVNLTDDGEETDGVRMARPISVVGVIRSGLTLTEGFLEVLPEAQVLQIGIEPARVGHDLIVYYESIPSDFKERNVIVLDSAVFSGQTLARVLEIVTAYKPRSVQAGVLLASRKGLDYVQERFPDVPVFAGALDFAPDEDTGSEPMGNIADRLFGTEEPELG